MDNCTRLCIKNSYEFEYKRAHQALDIAHDSDSNSDSDC